MENSCRNMWSNSYCDVMVILAKLKTHFKEEKNI